MVNGLSEFVDAREHELPVHETRMSLTTAVVLIKYKTYTTTATHRHSSCESNG